MRRRTSRLRSAGGRASSCWYAQAAPLLSYQHPAMRFLPPQYAKFEPSAAAVCKALHGSPEVLKSGNGFRLWLDQGPKGGRKQTIAFYWHPLEEGNWAEMAIDPEPLALDISVATHVLRTWFETQKLDIGGGRKHARHKDWGAKTPWPTIGFANQAGLELFLERYRSLLNPRFLPPARSNNAPAPGDQRREAEDPMKSVAAALLAQFRARVAAGDAETTREAIRLERIGQDLLRPVVLEMWGKRCALTGIEHSALIVTSHIKPWRAATDKERLDPYNALPLAAHIDAAFDAGLLSFHDDGRIILTSELSPDDLDTLGLTTDCRLSNSPTMECRKYLAWHRESVLRDEAPPAQLPS